MGGDIVVSVIIAVYNGEKYIKEAVESILNQTYKDIELIVVDDGSTDRTKEILTSYPNIKYVYQDNRGEGAARNLGTSLAKGDYIAFLDGDDLYKKDKIEKQINMLELNPEIDVVYCDLEVVDEKLKYMNTLKSEGVYDKREDLLPMMLYRQVVQGPICMMIRKKCSDAVKWEENYTYIVDYIYTINLAKKFNFKYLAEPLYVYRRHNNNLSNSHEKTLVEERRFLESIGIDEIVKIINNSSFDRYNRKILLAKILIKMLKYKEAQHILEEIKDIKKDEYVLFNLGNCFYKQRNIKEAQKCYESSLLINSTMAESYNNLGCVISYFDKKAAFEMFKKALDTRKGYMDAQINLDRISNNSSDYKLTEKELRKVLTFYN
ncbi:hypothetical protein N496_12830 [Clostridium botulinum A2B3 87]|nr:hypothetical protein N492_13790 [Clostridium botulinum B2 267]KEJ02807.1 hypothetical protein N496_12830 [Clostridium botulinum A2B3 87]OSB02596.1 hypothetical protein B2H88_06425 [Clostridium botulinum]